MEGRLPGHRRFELQEPSPSGRSARVLAVPFYPSEAVVSYHPYPYPYPLEPIQVGQLKIRQQVEEKTEEKIEEKTEEKIRR